MTAVLVLPRRAIAQPSLPLVSGGDCGACVVGGLVAASVADVYDRLAQYQRQSIQRENMEDVLANCLRDGLLDRVVTKAPSWSVGDRWLTFGAAARRQSQAWSTYARMAFDAGYYGLAEVDSTGRGVEGDGPDHWVLLCGWRLPADGTVLAEVLVSCSARHPEGRWVRVRDFLTRSGGFSALWARPSP